MHDSKEGTELRISMHARARVQLLGASDAGVSDCTLSCRNQGLLGCKSKLMALLTSPSRWEGLFHSTAWWGMVWTGSIQTAMDLLASSNETEILINECFVHLQAVLALIKEKAVVF